MRIRTTIDGKEIEGYWNEKFYNAKEEGKVRIYIDGREYVIDKDNFEYEEVLTEKQKQYAKDLKEKFLKKLEDILNNNDKADEGIKDNIISYFKKLKDNWFLKNKERLEDILSVASLNPTTLSLMLTDNNLSKFIAYIKQIEFKEGLLKELQEGKEGMGELQAKLEKLDKDKDAKEYTKTKLQLKATKMLYDYYKSKDYKWYLDVIGYKELSNYLFKLNISRLMGPERVITIMKIMNSEIAIDEIFTIYSEKLDKETINDLVRKAIIYAYMFDIVSLDYIEISEGTYKSKDYYCVFVGNAYVFIMLDKQLKRIFKALRNKVKEKEMIARLILKKEAIINLIKQD